MKQRSPRLTGLDLLDFKTNHAQSVFRQLGFRVTGLRDVVPTAYAAEHVFDQH
jgi:hypothetical protein